MYIPFSFDYLVTILQMRSGTRSGFCGPGGQACGSGRRGKGALATTTLVLLLLCLFVPSAASCQSDSECGLRGECRVTRVGQAPTCQCHRWLLVNNYPECYDPTSMVSCHSYARCVDELSLTGSCFFVNRMYVFRAQSFSRSCSLWSRSCTSQHAAFTYGRSMIT